MKQFTVKDFIKYNGPCFGCGNKINIKVCVFTKDEDISKVVTLTPVITNVATEIDLKISYKDSLKLTVYHKTNKFEASNTQKFLEYLKSREIYLRTICEDCHIYIDSAILKFNFPNQFIEPVAISHEILTVKDATNKYKVFSYFKEGKTTIHAIALNENKDEDDSVTTLNLPLLPLYKFRSKEHFLNKIKTYLIFS